MTDTLTYFQGLILKVVGELGEANLAEIGSCTHGKLEKGCQFTGSTIAANIESLVAGGFLVKRGRVVGELKIPTIFFLLTDKGRTYSKATVS